MEAWIFAAAKGCGAQHIWTVLTEYLAEYLRKARRTDLKFFSTAVKHPDMAKSHTRADWTRRPLPDAVLDYAAEDVEYLLPANKLWTTTNFVVNFDEWQHVAMTFDHTSTANARPLNVD